MKLGKDVYIRLHVNKFIIRWVGDDILSDREVTNILNQQKDVVSSTRRSGNK